MTTLTVFSDASDGVVDSSDLVLATAQAGTGSLATSGSPASVGQRDNAGTFHVYEAFLSFDTSTIPDDATVTAAVLSLWGAGGGDHSVQDFTLEARLHDFGATLENADFRADSALAGLTLLATYATSSGWSSAAYNVFASDGAFPANVNRTGSTRMVVASDRHRTNATPTSDEWVDLLTAEATGTANDPKLVVDYNPLPKARVSQEYAEAAISSSEATSPKARVTQQYAEAAIGPGAAPKARVTQQYAEAAIGSLVPRVRVTQEYVEVAISAVPDLPDDGLCGQVLFYWPQSRPATSWAHYVEVVPPAGSSGLGNRTIWRLNDGGGQVATLMWIDAEDVVRFTIGTTVLDAPASWVTGEHVKVVWGFEEGVGAKLAVKTTAGAVERASDPNATAAQATDELAYTSWQLGETGASLGCFRDVMMFDASLTDAEEDALLVAAARLGGLPSPGSRLVLYASGTNRPVEGGSPVSAGVTYQSVADLTSTRYTDPHGFTKGIAALVSGLNDAVGLSAWYQDYVVEYGMFLATTATGDDIDDHARQFYAGGEQQTRVR